LCNCGACIETNSNKKMSVFLKKKYFFFSTLFCPRGSKTRGGGGGRGSTVVKVLCYKSEGRWFDPSWCQWIFWHKILPIALWPWGRQSLQQKWVPGVFPGVKGGRCVRLTTYHHPVPLSWNLGTSTFWNSLGPSGPVTGLLYLYLLL